ncbi:MAG: HAMP domain-containing sensor histidine kinase, partial [Paracoccaceae bacterium]
DLGRAATGAMVTQWDAAGARHDTLRRATDQLIISILGIVVLGSFISVSMLRAMAARQSAQRSLEREQELRETYRTFVALASHQFQTPLSVIDASAQRLLRRGSAMPWEEVLRRAGDIRASVRQLTTLIGATLESIRLDSGQVTPDMRACDLPDLLERVRDQQLDAAPDRQVRIDIAAGVPRHITTDPFLVEQVLANLISNALKFSPGDEPVQVQVATAGAGLRFRVVDYGMGIPEAARGRVFEDFFRSVLARGVPGNGIGLNLARKIAELLGGSLVLERRQGPGAVFTFDLPVVEMGAAAR